MSPNQLFVLYLWFPLAAVLLFILLIARFFEKFSGRKTYYWALIPSIFGYGVGLLRYSTVSQLSGDLYGDLSLGLSGLLLLAVILRLFWMMVIDR